MTRLRSPEFRKELKEYCDRLGRLYDEPTIILSGSTALEEEMPWSDVDLIVIADFKKPFLQRLEELAPSVDSRFSFEVAGYTLQEFMDMLDSLNIKAIEAIEEGFPVRSGPGYKELKRKLNELKSMGIRRTKCSYRLEQTPSGC